METLMKIDPQIVKQLRDTKGWSQEHLAEVAGLSLRTVQRVEAEGSASAETKMALASALGIKAEELTPKHTSLSVQRPGKLPGVNFGIAGAALGTIAACIGIALGDNTTFESGVSFGLVGLLSGASFAAIGVISWLSERHQSADA